MTSTPQTFRLALAWLILAWAVAICEDSSYFIPPGTVIPAESRHYHLSLPRAVKQLQRLGIAVRGAGGGNPTCLAAGTVVDRMESRWWALAVLLAQLCAVNRGRLSGRRYPSVQQHLRQIRLRLRITMPCRSRLSALSQGIAVQASYTYSKAIDQGASFENILNTLNPRPHVAFRSSTLATALSSVPTGSFRFRSTTGLREDCQCWQYRNRYVSERIPDPHSDPE